MAAHSMASSYSTRGLRPAFGTQDHPKHSSALGTRYCLPRGAPAAKVPTTRTAATRHTISTMSFTEVEVACDVLQADTSNVEELEATFLVEGPLSIDELDQTSDPHAVPEPQVLVPAPAPAPAPEAPVHIPEPQAPARTLETRPVVEWWMVCSPGQNGRWDTLEGAKAMYAQLKSSQDYRLVYWTSQRYEEAAARLQALDMGGLPRPAGIISDMATQVHSLENSVGCAGGFSYTRLGFGKPESLLHHQRGVVMKRVAQELAELNGWQVVEAETPNLAVIAIYVDNNNARSVHSKLCQMQFSEILDVGVSLTTLEHHSYIDIRVQNTYCEDALYRLQRLWQDHPVQYQQMSAALATAHASSATAADSTAARGTATHAALGCAPDENKKDATATAYNNPYSRPFLLQAAFACADAVEAVKEGARHAVEQFHVASRIAKEHQAQRLTSTDALPLQFAAAYFVALHTLAKVLEDVGATSP